LLFIAGVALLGSIAFLNSYNQWASGGGAPSPAEMIKGMSSVILGICAVVTICIGVMGCLVIKCEHKCFIMLYGCGLGSTALTIFIVGCVFASTASWMPGFGTQICKPKDAQTVHAYQSSSSVDTGMLDLVNQNMCTSKCPCETNAFNTGYSSLPASNFTFNGRQKDGSPNGKTPITLAGGSSSFTNFQTCYNQNLRSTFPTDLQN
jgi:hypothetical protein